MYNNYFGLSESPFSIAPNPRYLFLSEQYQEALAHLLYGIGSNGGFVLLTGEVGTGKTTVCRRLLEQMPENTDVAMILNPKASVEELLAALCDELGIVYPPGDQVRSKTYIDLINRHLLDTHAQGRSTVLIIDEAQNLGVVLLEQIRLLTNLETNECKLLQIVLVGQPELLELLARPELRQLSQRITARFHLGALSLKDLEAYIVHRLAVAGLNRPIFPAATLKRLYRLSGGIPRVVNILCDRALLGSFVQRDNRVEVATLVKASREVFGDEAALQLSSKDSWRWLLALVVTAVLAAWLVGFAVAAWVADGARVSVFEQPLLERFSSFSLFDSPPGETAVSELNAMAANADSQVMSRPASVAKGPATQPGSSLMATAAAAMTSESSPNMQTLAQPLSDAQPDVQPAEPLTAPIAVPLAGQEEGGAPDRASAQGFRWQAQPDADLALVQAYRALFAAWKLDYDPRQNPVVCRYAETQGLGCLVSGGDLISLQQLNRPAVVSLKTDAGLVHATVLELNDEAARLIVSGKVMDVPYDELERRWPGSYTLLWRVPAQYRVPLWPGASGGSVEWLSQQMARLNGGVQLVAADRYDEKLVEQVRLFQMRQGLSVDAVVGPKTAIHLNTHTRTDLPLLEPRRER
ncbi:AAA family ATPase [Marinobacterium sedimentorum]|uniref:AAA family ATPase n=1 Tax=Marinobacterium sedimentorum TaxID=2927804 RepID=UPI0020C6196D|nr:AAA family ATPase [Marinobacterium sedimentorum]MCP8687232.1 AAA family ATPase [Marinobacterium sedimentorum]